MTELHNTQNRMETIVRPSNAWRHPNISEVWHQRRLIYFLAWRDIKVRYKQTVLGVLWVIIQPAMLVVTFSIIFGKLAKLPSDGIPYPLFVLSGLIPWLFFANVVTQSSNSVVTEAGLISKVYFPRLIVPIAAIAAGVLDFLIGLVLVLILMPFYGIWPGQELMLLLPLLFILTAAAGLSVGIWMAALNAKYRDFRYVIPYLIQFGMYATPVVYPSSMIPERFHWLYGINPMAGIIEAFRWGLLGVSHVNNELLAISTLMLLVLLVTGMYYFRNAERTFADLL